MSGYVFMLGTCVNCGVPFTFNPHRVPSLRRTPDGPREPICRGCVERANSIRVANGLDPIEIYPDSYEPIEEGQL